MIKIQGDIHGNEAGNSRQHDSHLLPIAPLALISRSVAHQMLVDIALLTSFESAFGLWCSLASSVKDH